VDPRLAGSAGERPASIGIVSSEEFPFIDHRPARVADDEMLDRARRFHDLMDARRSVREFSPDPVPREAIELAIRTASTAPSGAHRQPWRFVVVDDPAIKHEIRVAAEQEEKRSYEQRMPDEWLAALAPLGTTWQKPYLEIAPYLVVVFECTVDIDADRRAHKNYYVRESVGIACGVFVAALHGMGLCTLTHTPNPMAFLSRILGRPPHERPFVLFPIGHPAPDARVPDLRRKSLHEVAIWNPAPRR
jgi:iodotyrosine deiodinase